MERAVVVGAGLAGLTAAYRLKQAGYQVTVLEKGSAPGGRVATCRVQNYVVDTGPDALTESYRSYLGLLGELGLGDRIVAPSAVIGLIRNDRLLDLDTARPWTLIGTPALSLRAKLRLILGYLRLRSVLKTIDPYELTRSIHLDDPDSNAWEFAVKAFGLEVAEYLVDPMMRMVTSTGSRGVSQLNLLAALNSWTAPLVNVEGGLDVLPETLARQLDVRYGTEVTAVDESAETVTVHYVGEAGRDSLPADTCVIAAMYDRAAQIWPKLEVCAPRFGEALRFAQLITVSLGYSALTKSGAYVVQVPTVESASGLLVFMQHNKARDRAPAGHSLVTIYTDTTVTPEFLEKSDGDLEQWAADLIEKWCPELAGHRDLVVVTRWPKAGYLATPGFWRQSAALLRSLPDSGRIQMAGDLFGAGSMESAVRSGEDAARKCVHSADFRRDARDATESTSVAEGQE